MKAILQKYERKTTTLTHILTNLHASFLGHQNNEDSKKLARICKEKKKFQWNCFICFMS
jgi:hypothetical protein